MNVRYAAYIDVIIYAWYLQREFYSVKSYAYVFLRFLPLSQTTASFKLYQLWRTLYSVPLHHIYAESNSFAYYLRVIACTSNNKPDE